MHFGFISRLFFNLGIFESGTSVNYKVNIAKNGVYLFLIEGEIEVDNQTLTERDAMGITNFEDFDIVVRQQAKILLVEVPMTHA